MKELKCPKCGSVFTVDESDYADIVNQVKNAEFNAEVDRRIKELEKQQSIQQQADELKAQQQFQTKQLEFNAKLAEKENEIVRLKADIAEGATKIRVAVLEEQNKSKDELQKKEQKIAELKNELTVKDKEAQTREQNLKEKYDLQLQEKQTQIDYYKDLKTRLSTKMVGETLEQHCSTQFNTTIRPLMPNAYFEKDNDASEGSKGDFIFRDYDDGFDDLREEEEYIPELSPEEKAERTKSRARLAMDAGNLFGVITGAVLILVLLTLIFSIIHFVINDMGRSFSLFQTNF